MAVTDLPHPEERSQSASRRTHTVDPVQSNGHSDDPFFRIGLALGDARPAEAGEIDGFVAPVEDQLGKRPPAPRRVHQAVSGKTGGEIEILARAGPRSNDRIAVEIVLIVEAGQRILASGLLELPE